MTTASPLFLRSRDIDTLQVNFARLRSVVGHFASQRIYAVAHQILSRSLLTDWSIGFPRDRYLGVLDVPAHKRPR